MKYRAMTVESQKGLKTRQKRPIVPDILCYPRQEVEGHTKVAFYKKREEVKLVPDS